MLCIMPRDCVFRDFGSRRSFGVGITSSAQLTSRETNVFPVRIEVLISEYAQERVDGNVRCLEDFGEQEALQSTQSVLIAPGGTHQQCHKAQPSKNMHR